MLTPELESFANGLAQMTVVHKGLNRLAGLVSDPELSHVIALLALEQREAFEKLIALMPDGEARLMELLDAPTASGPIRPRGGADPSQN